jgi:hypothetical protein
MVIKSTLKKEIFRENGYLCKGRAGLLNIFVNRSQGLIFRVSMMQKMEDGDVFLESVILNKLDYFKYYD